MQHLTIATSSGLAWLMLVCHFGAALIHGGNHGQTLAGSRTRLRRRAHDPRVHPRSRQLR